MFLDQKTKCVVVSVRGTLSVSDTVVDFWCENTPIPSHEVNSEGVSEMCHAGALISAKGVFEELMDSGVLQTLLDKGERPVGGDDSVDWSEARNYDLMFVGHSLGGGIASLLSQV